MVRPQGYADGPLFRATLMGDQMTGRVQFGSFGEGSFLAERARGQAKPDQAEDVD